jgi:hypothetical protein
LRAAENFHHSHRIPLDAQLTSPHASRDHAFKQSVWNQSSTSIDSAV